jgi:hypothetical protein
MMIGLRLKHSVKYLNIGIFLILAVIFLLLQPYHKLSTNLLSLLPQNEESKLLKIYEAFKSSHEIIVAVKGSDEKAYKNIKELEQRILANDFIELKQNFFTNEHLKSYIKKYQFYLQNFNEQNLDETEILGKLQKSYKSLMTNPLYSSVDKIDPLKLFSRDDIAFPIGLKNGHLFLDDYGYMSIFTFKAGTNQQRVYNVFEKEITPETKIFGPLFYFVENAAKIKSEVNYLVMAGMLILIVLYFLILKNALLLTNTILTLLSSSMLALIAVTLIWDEVSVFVLVFGMAISTVSIDYMFHHYFCGFYEKKVGFNRSVFYGFLSTFLAFFIVSFVDFPFIRQVSIYALISLSSSYLIFAFIYPNLSFTYPKTEINLPSLNLFKAKYYKYFVFILIGIISFLSVILSMDLDIKNLDYKNVKLKNLEEFFSEKLGSSGKIPFIIKAKSIDTLIEKSRAIKALHSEAIVPLSNLLSQEEFQHRKEVFSKINFLHVRDKIVDKANTVGFRKDFFAHAYSQDLLHVKSPHYEIDTVRQLGFDVVSDGRDYFTYGLVLKDTKLEGVYFIDSTRLFKNSLEAVNTELLYCGVLILFSILLILRLGAKNSFYKSLSFVLFPLASTLFIISFNPINIIQIFMLFVIVSLSIDYGIYMSEASISKQSKRAILFSLLSTFAGFGILIFSSIGALFYIGEVTITGLVSVLILLVMGTKNEN